MPDTAALHAAHTAWQQHRGSEPHRQAMHELVCRLTNAGIRHDTIAAELGVTVKTVDLWRTGRRKPRRTTHARRPLTDSELVQLRNLLTRVDSSGRGYAWSSQPGRDFLTAAQAHIGDGVSAMRLAEHLAKGTRVKPETIMRRIAGPPRTIRRGPTMTRRDRTQKTPDEARVPRASRPVSPDEWAHLLALPHAANRRGGRYPADRRDELQHRQLERDQEILRLWADRVADAHIADLLGMSEAAITHARRRARRVIDVPPRRRPADRPPPPRRRTRHLTAAQAELLRAAWERVRAGPYRYGVNPYVPVFARLVADQHDTGVALIEIAAAVEISRTTLRSALAGGRHAPTD
jgi:hypothetical protein